LLLAVLLALLLAPPPPPAAATAGIVDVTAATAHDTRSRICMPSSMPMTSES